MIDQLKRIIVMKNFDCGKQCRRILDENVHTENKGGGLMRVI